MSRTVLVIDDDPLIRRLIVATLDNVGGYAIHEARSGEEGVETAARLGPEVVLVDYEMPGITGVETCRRLRAAGSEATVVMLTGSALEDTERRAREAGVDQFLTKPFSPLEVLRIVDAVSRR
jgi:two-component system chemotaxis response regulator CheY